MTGLTFRVRLLLALLFLLALGANAQTSEGETAITGVESLPGIDPMTSTYWQTNNDDGYNTNEPSKTFFLYNVGTGKFLNMGGAWGTQAAMHTPPKYFCLFNNVPGESATSPTKLNLRTKQTSQNATDYTPTGSTDYMQLNGQKPAYSPNKLVNPQGIYLDRRYNNEKAGSVDGFAPGAGWHFELADSSKPTIYQYKIYTTINGKKYYLMAKDAGDADAVTEKSGKTYNDVWKIIPMKQYTELFNLAPADLSKPTDASFLLKDPDFSVNNRYLSSWKTSGTCWFGTSYFKKTSTTDAKYSYPDKTNEQYNGLSKGDYQLQYGRYCNAMIYNSTSGEVWQGVKVTKPGWFIFRCRGISNVPAVLYAEQCTDNTYDTPMDGEYSSQSLNSFPASVSGATDKMLQAGMEFAQGNYENQVMLYVTPQSGNTYFIRFGVKLDNTPASSAKSTLASTTGTSSEKMTIFDSFRMLYAGKSEEPDLILDEDNTNLYYLTPNAPKGTLAEGWTTPVDTYQNTTLHLKRTFSLNNWNTIVLPVSLTRKQMKNTFGDDMKLAYLWELSDNTMRFLTVEPKNDDDTMLVANRPYIIYPTKGPGETQSIVATLHSSGEVAWSGYYKGSHVTDGKISIDANHYLIDRVTLVKDSIQKDTLTWKSLSYYVASKDGKETLTSYGTLAKTYSGGKIISKRDDCKDSYILKNGSFYLVPKDKQYGLKAFRAWFRYKPTNGSVMPTTMLFSINGVTDTTTGIEDIFADDFAPTATTAVIKGVYSLSGQRLRTDSDVSGLPAGIYIVNGKKYFVR